MAGATTLKQADTKLRLLVRWEYKDVAKYLGIPRGSMQWHNHASIEAKRRRWAYSSGNDALREVMAEHGIEPQSKNSDQARPRLTWAPGDVKRHADEIIARYNMKLRERAKRHGWVDPEPILTSANTRAARIAMTADVDAAAVRLREILEAVTTEAGEVLALFRELIADWKVKFGGESE